MSLSTFTGDEKAVWRDFRRELVNRDFKSDSLRKNKPVLQDYMLKLDESGILTQEHPTTSAESSRSQWYTKQSFTQTVNSLDDLEEEDAEEVSLVLDHEHPKDHNSAATANFNEDGWGEDML